MTMQPLKKTRGAEKGHQEDRLQTKSTKKYCGMMTMMTRKTK